MESYGIEYTKSSRRNPQSNAIIERIHQVMLNMIRTLELSDVIWDNEDRIWDIYLAKVSWAIRSTFSTITKFTPCQLAFNRDMILKAQKQVNWKIIRDNKHERTIRNNLKENSTRLEWAYKIGDKVLLDYQN